MLFFNLQLVSLGCKALSEKINNQFGELSFRYTLASLSWRDFGANQLTREPTTPWMLQ